MSGMGDGYVGTAQGRREDPTAREAKRSRETQNPRAQNQVRLRQGPTRSTSVRILETAFKKETVGLVTREEYVEKFCLNRGSIFGIKFEEEEKEKLQKLQQEEEELQLQKRKKRKIRGSSRLSFAEDIGSDSEEENDEYSDIRYCISGSYKSWLLLLNLLLVILSLYFLQIELKLGSLGLENLEKIQQWRLAFYLTGCSFSEREAEEQAERERLRKRWLREQEQIRNEPLEITYSYWDGAGHRRVIQFMNKLLRCERGIRLENFFEVFNSNLHPEFREIRTTSVENLLYVKEDLIIPHQHSFYELIVNKARGKSGPLFHFDVHEDVRTIADATIEKDESHAGKVVERHWYEKNKHIFPASRWEIYDPTKKWERYTIHGD
ncbi:hypothetical protein Patl1_36104 [Pistacia atlantica]|nr:hypothetical protein Patl1_36104 [Pistacia atlantica]